MHYLDCSEGLDYYLDDLALVHCSILDYPEELAPVYWCKLDYPEDLTPVH
jgi:hypothetical protein